MNNFSYDSNKNVLSFEVYGMEVLLENCKIPNHVIRLLSVKEQFSFSCIATDYWDNDSDNWLLKSLDTLTDIFKVYGDILDDSKSESQYSDLFDLFELVYELNHDYYVDLADLPDMSIEQLQEYCFDAMSEAELSGYEFPEDKKRVFFEYLLGALA